MDETNNLAPRERPNSSPSESLQQRSPFLALDLMPREPHLLDYLLVLRKHQWLIAFFLLAIVSIVTIATFRMQPIYEATARVEVDRDTPSAFRFNESEQGDDYSDLEDYIVTQSKILQSETLAMQTVKSMGLDHLPQFGGVPGKAAKPEPAESDASLRRPPALGAFLGGLSVKRVPNSRLLDVTFEATDPSLAARVVNAHLNNFIEQNFRSRFEAATQASNWMAGQLNEMKIKVENAEDARLEYERENQIWTIDEKSDITTQKLGELEKQLTDAQADRINKEAVYQLAQSGNYDAISAVRESAVIQDILKQQTTLSAQYTDAVSQYGPKFPKVLRIQAQLKDLDQLITREKLNIGNQVEADYRGSRQRELLLNQALDEQKAEVNQTAEKLVQYNILKREADTNKQLYDGMLQKLKEAGITAGLRSSNIRIVDPALIPSYPSRPNKTRNILLSIMVGFLGGIGLALLREYLDNTVKTPDDIETLARLPSLAVVPALSNNSGKRRGRFSKLLNTAVVTSKEGRAELISHNMPQSQMSEAFRALRTSLLLSQADHPPQVILMTSALPREGKTTAAVNLAVTLAQLGDKTLLVDADLRKPGINRALSLVDGKHAGLSSYLAGVSTLDLITVPHPAISNLEAIPTGPIPPNPADLLSSRRLTELITELRSRYKFVVIDSPPIMAATDAVILSVLVDGVLMVVRSGETPKEAFTRTRDLLVGVKAHMLGVVLNAVDASSPDYYYSYRYYPYSYGGYGREEDTRKSRKAKNGPKRNRNWVRTNCQENVLVYLITGGAGFIGSHLAERLLERGDQVLLMDNLSTGAMENIRHLKKYDQMHYFLEPLENRQLLAELVDEADIIFHLAAAVGVKLIVESPVRTIETNVNGTQMVLEAACRKRKLVFAASTSEVYGKNTNIPFHEDADLVLGPTTKGRWSYAASKALDEFLALSYWKEKRLPVVIARLFNTVGPRQTGRYGMVLPNFVRQALDGAPITVYGSGKQSRCFCDVRDAVEALLLLVATDKAVGEVVNVGNDDEITIENLAHLVKERTSSSSPIEYILYDEAYEPGFEDMFRRVPCVEKLELLTGFRPRTALPEIVDRVVSFTKDKRAGIAPRMTDIPAASNEGEMLPEKA